VSELINLLTPEELNKLESFLNSPYFCSQKTAVVYFAYLKKYYPHISKEVLSAENISVNVYKEKKVNDAKIRKLISNFANLLDRFFTQMEIDDNPMRLRFLLMSFLRKRGFEKRFSKKYKDIQNERIRKFSKDADYYIDQYYLDNEYYYFNYANYRSENVSIIQSKSDNLDNFFLFTKLHTFNEMVHLEGSKNKNSFYDRTFLNEINSYIEKNLAKYEQNHPNIYIIYTVFKMFETMDDNYLKKLKDYINAQEKWFLKKNLMYYYHYITQYFIKKINLGQTEYRKEVFEIYKLMFDKNLFLIDNFITDQEFNNVCNVSLSLNEFDWIEKFIEKYRNNINKDYAKDIYNLAKAKLAFYRKEYEKLFFHLNEVEFSDPMYYINSKILLARVYFEMSNLTSVMYIVGNLRQYLRINSNLTLEQSDTIKIFVKYITGLIKLKEGKSGEGKSLMIILKKQLDNEKKFVPVKSWFYEKLSGK